MARVEIDGVAVDIPYKSYKRIELIREYERKMECIDRAFKGTELVKIEARNADVMPHVLKYVKDLEKALEGARDAFRTMIRAELADEKRDR